MTSSLALEEMDLPFTSSNEDLETLSRNEFRMLFDIEKFEVRDECVRDKGIDFQIELKKLNKYTNFRFIVQLKSTANLLSNKDGSKSLQLETSNINYLLNSGMPAFYVLYIKESNQFFYENLNSLLGKLNKKNVDWEKQTSQVIRFTKVLNEKGLSEMYDTTLKKGLFQRNINERLALVSSSINIADKILVDSDLNVSDDGEIRELIDTFGFDLINEGKWSDIIRIHKKASAGIGATSRYNLVLGIANYYTGNFLDALVFFKTAKKLQLNLSDDLKDHLLFFETTVKYTIGIYSKEVYNQKITELENKNNIGLFIKLEKAKSKYLESSNNDFFEKHELLIKEIGAIINDPKANHNIVLNAKCELILAEGTKNNIEYVQTISRINASEIMFGPNIELRTRLSKEFIAVYESWYKQVQSIEKEAHESKNYFAYFIAVINEVRVMFEHHVYREIVYIEQEVPDIVTPSMPKKELIVEALLEKLGKAIGYYNQVNHIENLVVALSLKYEIVHYSGNSVNAGKILIELDELIDKFELENCRDKLSFIRNAGTTHERFKAFKDDIFASADSNRKEYDELVKSMLEMDESERNSKTEPLAKLTIELFPIGHFSFPSSAKEKVFEILQVDDIETKNAFNYMFEKSIVPVANIYYGVVSQEGHINGKLADVGIENWRNIYRVRKLFFDNNFFRAFKSF